jgi:hypothetical protein
VDEKFGCGRRIGRGGRRGFICRADTMARSADTAVLRQPRSSRSQLELCRRATRSKGQDSVTIGLRLASCITAGLPLICLSPSTPLLARVDSLGCCSWLQHEQSGSRNGVCARRRICLSREAAEARLSILVLDEPKIATSICLKAAPATIPVNPFRCLSQIRSHTSSKRFS